MELQRIDKIISAAALLSRKEARDMIKKGCVKAGGKTVRSPDEKYDVESVEISVKGEKVLYRKKHYFMINKPSGYVSATEDGRDKTVLELLDKIDRKLKLFPVGRLDKDTEGLLILTDDGEFCHDVISPKKHVFKKYFLEVDGKIESSDCDAVEKGIELADGSKCLPGKLEIIEQGEKSRAFMTICEGKYHQVKRMMASLGKPVVYLKRVQIGELSLDSDLKTGEYRELTEKDIGKIFGKFD